MPLSLCLVPLYGRIVWQTTVSSPDWWKTVEMQYIRDSPNATLVIGFFLFSNICYFLSGGYLLALQQQHQQQQHQQQHYVSSVVSESAVVVRNNKNKNSSRTTSSRSSMISGWPLALVTTLLLKATVTPASSSLPSSSTRKPHASSSSMASMTMTTRCLLLQQPRADFAFWILTSGLVSTIFHSVQAMGGYGGTLAEALCYIDHGVAGAAVFYFWNICGRPRRHTLHVSAAGLVALALPLRPGYAWLHSLWHLLSATAALLWAFQKKTSVTTMILPNDDDDAVLSADATAMLMI
jgi:hypothetical protein